ncbi:flagellar motor switch phosphatase FliY [Longirhabdus pacifica]|uniref:flagellar motor switch phosphatase FliY n=1 Tax=Longirhabdus pacifica TaxID=2305227 RepID=UPI001008CE21|nr:flagellar motor switch phosphatase FliY [Longirhabdus pacifica]
MSNNKEYLSQDEIDALLNASDSSEDQSNEITASPTTMVDQYLTSLEQDALGEIGNITFGSAATALSTLMGKKVDITTPQVSIIQKTKLQQEFPKPHVTVHVKYVDGFVGTNLLVIQTQDAKVIANLMLGKEDVIEPEDSPLDELHLSAVQEAMNQMMGSSATSMSTIFNRFVNISPPGIDILDVMKKEGVSQLPEGEVLVKISFRLKIGDVIDSSIMQLLPVDFAKELVQSLLGSKQDVENTETPSTESKGEKQMETNAEQTLHNQTKDSPSYTSQQEAAAVESISNQRDVNVQPVQYTQFSQQPVTKQPQNLDLLMDIPLNVTVELGRTSKQIREILELNQGSIVELDKLAGEPVDILVNSKLIAKGEVVVIDENFGVRVTDIVSPMERLKNIQ